ncbi:MAG: hypothetical protein KDK61_08735, partial [Simkania sp.]|nr:hypothetical protein [Simkania sp.]
YNATRTPLVTFPIPLRMQGQLLYPNLGGIIGDETFRKGNTLEGTLDQEKIDRFMERVIDYRISRHSMLEALGK